MNTLQMRRMGKIKVLLTIVFLILVLWGSAVGTGVSYEEFKQRHSKYFQPIK